MYEVGLHGSSGIFPNRFFIFDDFANGYVFTIRASSVSRFHGPLETLELTSEATTKLATISGNVLIGTTTDAGFKLDVNGTGRYTSASSSSVPTLMLNQGSGAGAYANIAGAGDMYHGLILRGIPAAAGDYSVTAGDQMSFYEYGGDFRFYKKQPGILTQQMSIRSGGNVLIGSDSDTGDKLRVNGTTFSNNIMTWNPQNDNRSGVAWRLGAASIGTDTLNRRLRVNVGGVEYYIGAVEV
jgi:hypothetical protein